MLYSYLFFFFSSRRRHTRCYRDWSSDVCSSDLWLANRCLGARCSEEDVVQVAGQVGEVCSNYCRKVLGPVRRRKVSLALVEVLLDVVADLENEVGLRLGEALPAAPKLELRQPDRNRPFLGDDFRLERDWLEQTLELCKADEESTLAPTGDLDEVALPDGLREQLADPLSEARDGDSSWHLRQNSTFCTKRQLWTSSTSRRGLTRPR